MPVPSITAANVAITWAGDFLRGLKVVIYLLDKFHNLVLLLIILCLTTQVACSLLSFHELLGKRNLRHISILLGHLQFIFRFILCSF